MHLTKTVLVFLLCIPMLATAQDTDKFLKRLQQEGRTLYFIKPVKFKSKNPKSKLLIDYTYNHGPKGSDTVAVKFTITTKEPVEAIDRLVFSRGENQPIHTAEEVERMYLEQKKKKWVGRFTTHLPFEQYQQVLAAGPDFQLTAVEQERQFVYEANRKWKKSSRVVEAYFRYLED